MKERPILFSGPMVRAILDGRKTQTRRIIDPQPSGWPARFVPWWRDATYWEPETNSGKTALDETWQPIRCPYGEPGDQLWRSDRIPGDGWYYVRNLSEDKPVYLRRVDEEGYSVAWGWDETDDPEAVEIEGILSEELQWKRPGDRLWVREDHYRFGHWEPMAGIYTKGGRQKWCFIADSDELLFVPPSSFRGGRRHNDPFTPMWYKRIGRFMPRWASRTTLEVVSVAVERLQSISDADIRAEGVATECVYIGRCNSGRCPEHARGPHDGTRPDFKRLWKQINGADSWGSNPWVWVITFKVVQP